MVIWPLLCIPMYAEPCEQQSLSKAIKKRNYENMSTIANIYCNRTTEQLFWSSEMYRENYQ